VGFRNAVETQVFLHRFSRIPWAYHPYFHAKARIPWCIYVDETEGVIVFAQVGEKKGTFIFFLASALRRSYRPVMPRTGRADRGGICYYVINRGNARRQIFFKAGDYQAFLKALGNAHQEVPVTLLGYCLMPNHFHLIAWPGHDGELGRFMHWLENAHVRRYHRHYRSSGHLYQGRFKSFPIQQDEHLLTVLRYVERNPIRAGLVERAEEWPWSSARWRRQGESPPLYLQLEPVARPPDWLDYVQQPLTLDELQAVRTSVNRGRPYGTLPWMQETAQALGLEPSLRPRGRPRKTSVPIEDSLFQDP